MSLDPTRCPEDLSEIADLYCLGQLSLGDAQIFEDHFLECDYCAAAVDLTEKFIISLEAAVRQQGAGGLESPPLSHAAPKSS